MNERLNERTKSSYLQAS